MSGFQISNQTCSGVQSLKGMAGTLSTYTSSSGSAGGSSSYDFTVQRGTQYPTISSALAAAEITGKYIQSIFIFADTYAENLVIPLGVSLYANYASPPLCFVLGNVQYSGNTAIENISITGNISSSVSPSLELSIYNSIIQGNITISIIST